MVRERILERIESVEDEDIKRESKKGNIVTGMEESSNFISVLESLVLITIFTWLCMSPMPSKATA
jgi:hypothetical protein